MGIKLRVENETKNYRGIADSGTEIRDNTIDRSACSDKPQRLAGNAAIATYKHSGMTVSSKTPLLFATLCEGNRIKNSTTGFDLNGRISFAIRDTSNENCPKAVNERGHETARLPGNLDPLNLDVSTIGTRRSRKNSTRWARVRSSFEGFVETPGPAKTPCSSTTWRSCGAQ
jgi:hypothetical protein